MGKLAMSVTNVFEEIVSLWKRQRRNWKTIVIWNIFNRIFQRLTMDYSGIYVLKLGASPFQLGLLNGAAGLTNSIASAPMGWLQDKHSLRKIFLIGVGIMVIAPFIYALATDWIMIIPAVIILAIGQVVGSCMIICDISLKTEDRSTGKSICESAGMVPSLFSPFIAASLITVFGGISVDGIRPLYWIQFAGSFVLFFFLALHLTEIKRIKASDKKSSFLRDFHEVFKRGTALKRYLLLYVLSRFALMMTTPFRMAFAYEIKNANQFLIGWMTTSTILVYVLFAIPLGRLADRIGRKKVFYAVTPLVAASNLLLVSAPTPEILILSGIFLGFQDIANFTLISAMRADLVPQDCIGRWDGIVGMFAGLVNIPAPIIGGILWNTFSPDYIFLIPTLILVILIPIMFSMPNRSMLIKNRKAV